MLTLVVKRMKRDGERWLRTMAENNGATLATARAKATTEFADWLLDRKNARRIPHRLEACGYVAVRDDGAKDGQWKVDGKRQAIYAKDSLPLRERIAAAQRRAGIR